MCSVVVLKLQMLVFCELDQVLIAWEWLLSNFPSKVFFIFFTEALAIQHVLILFLSGTTGQKENLRQPMR